MPILTRGTILTRRLVATGSGAPQFTDSNHRISTKRYEGMLKPIGGDPIPYLSTSKLNVGDMVRFSGTKRATNVQRFRTLN